MWGLGPVEIILIILVVVILFFPERTKDIVKNLGVAVKAFKEGASEVEEELNKSKGGRSRGKS